MNNIGQLLERGFFGGMIFAAALVGFTVFLYLIYRLFQSLRPQKERQEERRIRSHPFYHVSGRGRIAYLILCLEEVLPFYGQDLSAWEQILRELWRITSCSEGDWIGCWLDSVGELLPSMILTNRTDESFSHETRKIQNLYQQSGPAMILVNTIMENAYTMVCEWSPDNAAYDPGALRFIDEVEEMMKNFGVPLPANEAVSFLVSQKDFSLGKPFDGLHLSRLSKKDFTA